MHKTCNINLCIKTQLFELIFKIMHRVINCTKHCFLWHMNFDSKFMVVEMTIIHSVSLNENTLCIYLQLFQRKGRVIQSDTAVY